jgi:dipeptidyl aminopeptidase/acylaminoacyl peptidase
MKARICAGLLAIVSCVAVHVRPAKAADAVDLGMFVRRDAFTDIKLSPDGEFLAATVQREDRTGLVVLSRKDNRVVSAASLGKNNHVADFWWVNPERVMFSVAQKLGSLDLPQLTGELYAMNADGSKKENLLGYRVENEGPGTRIQPKKAEAVAGFLVDTLPDDDRNVVVMVRPFGDLSYTRAEKMDVYSGRRVLLARAPVQESDFLTDAAGIVRFAYGRTSSNANQLYYREGDGKEWQRINDEMDTARVEIPLGFGTDQRVAYLSIEQPDGTDAIVAMDVGTGQRKDVLRNANVDPDAVLSSLDGKGVPTAAVFFDGKPSVVPLDPQHGDARLLRALQETFPGEFVEVTSTTRDGKLALVQVSSDRNPGDFYIFDVAARKMDYLLSRRDWLDPERLAPSTPIQLKARDGLVLRGYMTLPRSGGEKNLPLIVYPHGGPYGVRDRWGFDSDVQMLAAAGYAVLQVNFRGSGGYGRAFQQAGAREWGGTMQDDLTDATRWAIQSGVADSKRICIYGASYGAYAALTGAAKEPDLYRCAAGNVGVYDLPMMHSRGDTQEAKWGRTYLRDWIGEAKDLAPVSPTNMATRIKAPVFLAAGGEDERAPIQHTELMERRLKAAGVPVEASYYPTEGHGYYKEENQRDYYTKLLAFFSRHLGGATAK